MKKNGYIFEIGGLIHAEQGTRIKFDFSETESFDVDGNIELLPPLKAKVTFMTLEDGIHVNIEDFSVAIKSVCSKCLNNFNLKLSIPQAERVYFKERQRGSEVDDFDTFYIDMKNMTIDLREFFRQEIILHFPQVPVCLKSCKGLCLVCGKNLNKEKCGCKNEDEEYKPLSALKDLSKKLFK